MSKDALKGCKIAILATNGFEQSELMKPKQLLEEAGATTVVVAPGDDQQIKGWNHGEWGEQVKVDVPLAKASAADYDALVLPGGVINPDKLRCTTPRSISSASSAARGARWLRSATGRGRSSTPTSCAAST